MRMAPRFMMTLVGRDIPTIRHARTLQPSIINEKTVADFTRVVEQTRILETRPAPTPGTAADAAD